MTGAAAIRGERHARKLVETELGCSPAQADRIVRTGRPPLAYRDRFIALLKRLRDHGRERVRALDAEILLLEHRARAARARAEADGAAPAPVAAPGRLARPDHPVAGASETAAALAEAGD